MLPTINKWRYFGLDSPAQIFVTAAANFMSFGELPVLDMFYNSFPKEKCPHKNQFL